MWLIRRRLINIVSVVIWILPFCIHILCFWFHGVSSVVSITSGIAIFFGLQYWFGVWCLSMLRSQAVVCAGYILCFFFCFIWHFVFFYIIVTRYPNEGEVSSIMHYFTGFFLFEFSYIWRVVVLSKLVRAPQWVGEYYFVYKGSLLFF